MKLAPVILFVYNRPWHARETLQSLAKNVLANESELFIYADGARKDSTPEQLKKIKEVREIIREIKWCKKVSVIESAYNKGLSNSVISGVTEIIDKYGKAIVLEDDMITSSYFLKFMNEALNKYEVNDEIACISGYVYPVKERLPETFFLKGADCWGWATWKRGWDILEGNGKELLAKINERSLNKEFDFNFSYPYTAMLQDQIDGKNDSWAIKWYASAFMKGMLTLYPGHSLVQNIGTDESGSHFSQTNKYKVKLADRAIVVDSIPVKESASAREYFENYFRTLTHKGFFSKKIFKRIIFFFK